MYTFYYVTELDTCYLDMDLVPKMPANIWKRGRKYDLLEHYSSDLVPWRDEKTQAPSMELSQSIAIRHIWELKPKPKHLRWYIETYAYKSTITCTFSFSFWVFLWIYPLDVSLSLFSLTPYDIHYNSKPESTQPLKSTQTNNRTTPTYTESR